MERRFSMNDFEQSLKEHADEFKMIPSKKVWHGIYNDLHPGRRWPSVSMSFLLIFTLVVIGHLNNHTGTQTGNSVNIPVTSKNAADNLKPVSNLKIAQKITPQKNVSSQSNIIASTAYQPGNIKSNGPANINSYSFNNVFLTTAFLAQNNIKLIPQSGSEQFEKNNIFLPELNADANIENNIFDAGHNQSIDNTGVLNNSDNLNSIQQITIGNNNVKYSKSLTDNKTNKGIEKINSGEEDKKISKLKQKKNAKISWVYFAAPQVNSVLFNGNPIRPLMNTSNSPAVAINQRDYKVLHNPAPGFETGIQMNYTFANKLSFTSGMHITYSGYNITSNEVHPTFANLFLKEPETGSTYSKSYITHYGDGTGQTPVTIRNYSLQASLPIGLQYEFSGNDKIQFNASADFEPSMIIKSNAYLLSSDGNNYVNDPDLLRKINMSSNFGVFATFLSSKFRWQIGPNVRYQWLSTYKKDYPIQEHLIDYGIRFGISPLRK